MRFQLKPGSKGIMKKFVGEWQIHPHPTDPGASITYLDQVRERECVCVVVVVRESVCVWWWCGEGRGKRERGGEKR